MPRIGNTGLLPAVIVRSYDAGNVDGVLGSRTRASIRQYQASQKLTVNERLDAETAGKLGVGPESRSERTGLRAVRREIGPSLLATTQR